MRQQALAPQPPTPLPAHGNAAKTWWAPMWRGLVADPDAKHYRAMRSAVWLYLYLLVHADRGTGLLKRRIRTIAMHTGLKERTIQYHLRKLREAGYITVQNSGRGLTIQIQKWKPLGKRRTYQVGRWESPRPTAGRPDSVSNLFRS